MGHYTAKTITTEMHFFWFQRRFEFFMQFVKSRETALKRFASPKGSA